MATSPSSSDHPSARQHSAEHHSARHHLARHHRALAQAVFVTFLWSTSWVLIKFGLEAMPPLLFAGLRYGLASLILWRCCWPSRETPGARGADSVRTGSDSCALGVSCTPSPRADSSSRCRRCRRRCCRWPELHAHLRRRCCRRRSSASRRPGGRCSASPSSSPAPGPTSTRPPSTTASHLLGLVAAAVAIAANAGGSLLGRAINRHRSEERPSPDALVVTTVSMTVGSALLLSVGLAIESAAASCPPGRGSSSPGSRWSTPPSPSPSGTTASST